MWLRCQVIHAATRTQPTKAVTRPRGPPLQPGAVRAAEGFRESEDQRSKTKPSKVEAGELGPAGHVEPGEGAVEVVADGLGAEEELRADCRVYCVKSGVLR
jgi:hypothetical protein